MKFERVFTFLLKRFEEIGYGDNDVQELKHIFNRIRVKSRHIVNLDSGLKIDPDYCRYGHKED